MDKVARNKSSIPVGIRRELVEKHDKQILRIIGIALVISCCSIIHYTIFPSNDYSFIRMFTSSLFVLTLIIGAHEMISYAIKIYKTGTVESIFDEEGILLLFHKDEGETPISEFHSYKDIIELDFSEDALVIKFENFTGEKYAYTVLDVDGFIEGTPSSLSEFIVSKTNLKFYPELKKALKKGRKMRKMV